MFWGRGRATEKPIGWVVVRALHVLEVGPRVRGSGGLLGGARVGAGPAVGGAVLGAGPQ